MSTLEQKSPRAIVGRTARRRQRRGVALILVLSSLTILAVMLAEFQDTTSVQFSSAITHRDSVKAEYAARSAINLTRLLVASEPTVRQAVSVFYMAMGGRAPQIPVWEYSDRILGAFNDEDGATRFKLLSNLNISDGKNLGLDGAGFEIQVTDEDGKINLNMAARGDDFSKVRLAAALAGLMNGPQHDTLFANRDGDGNFSDRQTICSAIIDWADPDQDVEHCELGEAVARTAVPEDSFYQALPVAYQRKNAAFDSLEELRMVRGVGDDFWSVFVDPEPDAPWRRPVTVWGQASVNVNTANAQTALAVACSRAVLEESPLCTDPTQMMTFISSMDLVRSAMPGVPPFPSEKAFLDAMKGQGPIGTMMSALGVQPIRFVSESDARKVISTKSQIFSVYSTGYVRSRERETRVHIHAVVDFRGAPEVASLPGAASPSDPESSDRDPQAPSSAAGDPVAGALKPDPAGKIVYFRIN